MKIKMNPQEAVRELQLRYDIRKKAEEYYRKVITDVVPITKTGKERFLYSFTPFELENRQYCFSEFEMIEIGEPVALNESEYLIEEGKCIYFCKFKKSTFRNVRFVHCNFIGCTFDNVLFENVVFDSCFFSQPFFERDHLEVSSIQQVTTFFKDCNFQTKFINCSLETGYFEKCAFVLSKFFDCDLSSVYFDRCALSKVEIKDCKLLSFKVYKVDILDVDFTDDKYSLVNDETIFDPMVYAGHPSKGELVRTESGRKKENYDEMVLEKAKTLHRVSNLFERNGYNSLAGEYFYQSKRTEHLGLHGTSKAISAVGLALCGYGERPLFTLICILISIMAFALIYLFTGFSTGTVEIGVAQIVDAWPNILHIIKYYGHSLFFSITTFSTVGYGNYVPIGEISSFFAAVQMIVGVSLSALWTGCIFRKIVR